MAARVEWHGERVSKQAKANCADTLTDIGALGAELASGFSPVDTGALRDDWHGLDAVIQGQTIHGGFWNGRPYIWFVNNGTSKMAGHFMAQRALDIIGPDIPRRIQQNMRFD